MKDAEFDFSKVAAVSGTGQVLSVASLACVSALCFMIQQCYCLAQSFDSDFKMNK